MTCASDKIRASDKICASVCLVDNYNVRSYLKKYDDHIASENCKNLSASYICPSILNMGTNIFLQLQEWTFLGGDEDFPLVVFFTKTGTYYL